VLQAYIKFISAEKTFRRPDMFSVGGYSVLTPEGEEIHFDWNLTEADVKVLPSGRFSIEAKLSNFDYDYFSENRNVCGFNELNIARLTDYPLESVYYECQLDGVDLLLRLDTFQVYDHILDEEFSFDCEDFWNRNDFFVREDD
jgi:hypothetical protein